ncbi:MAG: hypothetical protein JKX70_00775 [Phycisphaerales bacterium]|nr:hypothetical protein [Phycisphaerales bacterium]
MSNQDQSHNDQYQGLSVQDRAVLDRIFGDDPESFEVETDRDHAVLNLLNLLDSPVASELQRPSRIDLVQILAARLESSPNHSQAELSTADQHALDQYVNQGFDVEQVDEQLQERAAKCAQIGEAITNSSAAPSSDLVARTLATIQSHIDQEESAMAMASPNQWVLSGRWADLVSVAAMLLIVASITLPIMSGVRSNAQQAVCFDNMHQAANAFGLYAGSNRDMLPMATAGFGSTWMDVGSTPERSNSSNLFTLIRTHNADLDDLACPSNPNAATGKMTPGAMDWRSLEEVSYSYRIMPPGGMRATAAAQPVRVVLLADRSPVILRVSKRQPIIPEENSPNHNGSGQHMLMLDGGTQWTTSPVINAQDNIWLPRPIEQVIHQARSRLGIITGSEMPAGPTDAFVGP